MKNRLGIGLCVAAFLQTGVLLPAATVTWTGAAGDSQWFTDANWDTGVSPGNSPADDILIDNADVIYTPGGDFSPSGSLTIGPGASFTQVSSAAWPSIAAKLQIDGTLDWGSAEQIRYRPGTQIVVGSDGCLIHRATVVASEGDPSPTLTVRGGEVVFEKNLEWQVAGPITVEDGGSFKSAATFLLGTGGLTISDSTAEMHGITFQTGATLEVHRSSITVTNAFAFAGDNTIVLDSAMCSFGGLSTTYVALILSGDTHLEISGNYVYDTDDSIEGGTLVVGNEFQWKENKTVNGDIVCKILACQSSGAQLTLSSGSVTTGSSSYNGFYVGGGSVNFGYGSTAKLNFAGASLDTVYDTYFSNGSVTYCSEKVTADDFAELFTVEPFEAEDGTAGASIYLTPAAEGAVEWDGTAAVTKIGSTQATVSGTLKSAGSVAGQVYLYAGRTFGGTDPAAWEQAILLGDSADGQVYSGNVELLEGSLYYFGMAVVAEDGTSTWAVFHQKAYLAEDNVNTFLGSAGTDGANAANWSLGVVPAADQIVFVSPEVSQSDLIWGAGMTDTVAGWRQPKLVSGRSVLVTFQTTVEQPLRVNGDVIFESGTWTHDGPAAEPAYAFAMDVSGDFLLGEEAQINTGNGVANSASGRPRGYMQAGPGFAPQTGSAEDDTLVYNLGASHGGEAGANGYTYGSILNPLSYGSSGHGDNNANYSGGGIIVLTVEGTLTLNGDISSDGFGYNATGACKGASAGGTVNLTVGMLAGNGTVSADGGSSIASGSGAGGRIRCKLQNGTFADSSVRFSALGGVGSADGWETAGAGTIFLQTAVDSAEFGTVRIANNTVYSGKNDVTRYTAIPSLDMPTERLNRVSWELASTARVRVTVSRVLGSIVAEEGAMMGIGKGIVARTPSLTIGETVYASGVYTSETMPEFLTGDGALEITNLPLCILFR
ncbi:MAG: hypothetical protein ACI4QT_01380 [Kiritimatiellia bacterium]